MIDSEGFRSNVGIVICNRQGQLLWAKRIGQSAWQFPQGGIKQSESVEEALFRELDEEVGLSEADVQILHQTKDWLYYRLPENFIRQHSDPLCIGQKQKWFLMRFRGSNKQVNIETSHPEFADWKWVVVSELEENIVEFKKAVYRQVIKEFKSHF